MALDLASRLRQRELLEEAFRRVVHQSHAPHLMAWKPETVATGDAGLALVCAQLDACWPEQGWDRLGHDFLTKAVQRATALPSLHAGLFAGLSGVVYATCLLSRGGTRYQRLLKTLEQRLFPMARELAERMYSQTQGFPVSSYDIVSGLAGVGAALLTLPQTDERDMTLRAVLESLVFFLREDPPGFPAWYIAPEYSQEEFWSELCPAGAYNCGLAHGVPGPLALLALAKLQGVTVPGSEEAMHRVADWLVAHRIQAEYGWTWPLAVPVNQAGELPEDLARCRSAWCYGTPGVARALWLTGEALDTPLYQETAFDAMLAVYRRPIEDRRIFAATFCHGVAGLLHITLHFANATERPGFLEAANALTEQLLALYEPDSLLGYRNEEMVGLFVDQPSVLDGAAGVLLVLLAASTEQRPVWDRLFLLS
uniref:Lanthionine synthetase n=1 Tax=Thermosporothrix sp. COM3 TaxID=2490863 RepID=A0A455SEV8_9CHLR|nr:hypothetical protein KTC_17540 [Thermosporothrix sp. COM3]